MRRIVAATLSLGLWQCALGPLRFRDATADATVEDDAAMEAAVVADASDAAIADVSEDASEDVSALGRSGSCRDSLARPDCRLVPIDPSGSFCVGIDAPEGDNFNARPQRCDFTVSPFVIDAMEVTAGRFRAFYSEWRDGTMPRNLDVVYPRGVVYHSMLQSAPGPQLGIDVDGCNFTTRFDATRVQHPMNCITWQLASHFCAWEGGRLPTSAEFEYVARWWRATEAHGRQYSWGDSLPDCAHSKWSGCPSETAALLTVPVGSLPAGSVNGQVFEMSGNVAEWVADTFYSVDALSRMPCWSSRRDPLCDVSEEGEHFARGGSHNAAVTNLLTTWSRPRVMTTMTSNTLRGFRCVYPRGYGQ